MITISETVNTKVLAPDDGELALAEFAKQQHDAWLQSKVTVKLLNYLVRRERETLERARDRRADAPASRDFLTKSEVFKEIHDYACTDIGKRTT